MSSNNQMIKKPGFQSLFWGGLLPIVIYTVVENQWGLKAGLIISILFGVIEVIYEKLKFKKIETITLISNGLIISLGAVSYFLDSGVWFKMQPAILEFIFFIFLLGSWFLKKPFLKTMILKQNPDAPEFLMNQLDGLTFRLSLFFLLHSLIATWAAFKWTTEQWALLKGVGLTVTMILYMLIEMFFIKKKAR